MRVYLLVVTASLAACSSTGSLDPRWTVEHPWEVLSDERMAELEPRTFACANIAVDDPVDTEGRFHVTLDDAMRGPWRMTPYFPGDGDMFELEGCIQGAYGNCMWMYLHFDIGQVVRDEPLEIAALPLDGTPGRFNVAASMPWEDHAWLPTTSGPGSGAITRYVPADGEFAAEFDVTLNHDPSGEPTRWTFDIDLRWDP